MSRRVILSVSYHVEGSNCFSSRDGKYLAFSDFSSIRSFIDTLPEQKKPKYISLTSTSKVFIIHLTYEFMYNREKEIYEDELAKFLVKEAYEELRDAEVKERKDKGYVNTFTRPQTLLELWGKLPKQIIIDNLDYLASGVVFGYFGASERMVKHDEWIAEMYDQNCQSVKDKLSIFLNHSEARHFMDNVYPEMSKTEFCEGFKKYMERF